MTPMRYWEESIQTWTTMAQAQAVMTMRLWGMAGAWNVAPGENQRMIAEKQTAFLTAQMNATRAFLTGQSPARIMKAAALPIRRKVRSNARRLARRGPF